MDVQKTGQQTNAERISPSEGETRQTREKHPTPKEELSALGLQRIHELREASLKSPEKLENYLGGCLGPVICDLLEYLSVMKSEFEEMINEEPAPFERWHQLQDIMDGMLPVHRQLDRYAQLICRIQELGKSAKKNGSR